jgi:4-amino-4-deoxy-L-arabinose transferase-like glycosyltransferase
MKNLLSKNTILNFTTVYFFIAVLGFLISAIPVIFGIFAFTFDGARDLLWVDNQIIFRKPSLIGPWGSLSGVFFGPLWFWLLAIPHIVSGGHPIGAALFNGIIVFSAVFIASFLYKTYSNRVAFFIGLFGFLSQAIIMIARYPFSQHLLPLFTMLLIYSLVKILEGNKRFLFLSFFIVSLMFHAEPPTALLSLPSIAITVLLSRQKQIFLNFKSLFLSSVAFIIPLSPLILFDLRHDFIQFKAVLAFFTGENQSLGGVIPNIFLRFYDRMIMFFSIYKQTTLHTTFFSLVLLGVIFYINNRWLKLDFLRKSWKASLIYAFSLLIFFVLFPPELKPFYLDGLIIISILWMGLA